MGLRAQTEPRGGIGFLDPDSGLPVGSRRRRGGEYGAWLDERDARVPLTRADLWSRNDEAAARVRQVRRAVRVRDVARDCSYRIVRIAAVGVPA